MSDALKVLDLFAGIGGFSLGLERTGGFKTVAFCEIDKAAQKVLKKHWPDVPVFEDIKTLKGEDVGAIDVITGGFPCQDISVAGKGAGIYGARSGLWWEYHRIIKETKPKWVIAENVSALRSRGLDEVLRSLAEIGYDAEWHCIPASAVGAPHRRDRIWIVGKMANTISIRLETKRPKQQTTGITRNSQETNVAYPSSRRFESLSNRNTKSNDAVSSSYNVANSNNSGSGTSQHDIESEWEETFKRRKEQPFGGSSGCCQIVRAIETFDTWEVEPNVGRVADGVSGRVDRLKQLGNAVVPQIPELIGRAILQKENLD